MKIELFRDTPVWYKLVITVFIVLSCFLLSFIISMVIAIPVFKLNIEDIQVFLSNGVDLTHVQLLKFLQVFQTIGTFLLSSLLLAFLFSGNISSYLKIKKVPSGISIVLIVLSVVVAIPAINYVAHINSLLDLPDSFNAWDEKMQQLENKASELMELFLDTPSFGGYAFNLFMIAILPAFGEEFLFRGIFQRLFSDLTKNSHLGVIFSALLFSFFHFQFYGFIPRFLLGVYFGYLLVWSHCLWLPIIAHFINNGIAVTFYHFSSGGINEQKIDTIGTSRGDFIYLLGSILIFSLLAVAIYLFEKKTQKNQNFLTYN